MSCIYTPAILVIGVGQTIGPNLVLAGPASGPAAAPTFRALVAADLPSDIAYTDVANVFTRLQTVQPPDDSTKGVIVKRHSSVTTGPNLVEAQDQAGGVLTAIDPVGNVRFSSAGNLVFFNNQRGLLFTANPLTDPTAGINVNVTGSTAGGFSLNTFGDSVTLFHNDNGTNAPPASIRAFYSNDFVDGTPQEAIRIRTVPAGTAAAGYGTLVDWRAKTTVQEQLQGEIQFTWGVATDGVQRANMLIGGHDFSTSLGSPKKILKYVNSSSANWIALNGDQGSPANTFGTLRTTINGDLYLITSGASLCVNTAANGMAGFATLTAGTVTVNNTHITGNTLIFLSPFGAGANPGAVYVSARVAGTSFTITSTNVADSNNVAWFLIEPV